MSTSSEEVLLIVKNVKNKKTDGTLYMMGERMGWMVASKDVFNISYMYADIKAQKISSEKKEKVQLQVIMNDGSANTFLFNTPLGRDAQMHDREAIKELLQQLLPKFKRKISSELEEKNRVLQQDPESFQLYKDLVVSGVISPDEFWASRSHMLTSSTPAKSVPQQNVGVSPAFLADIKPQTDGANGLKYNLTADVIQSIFQTYPMVKKKHAECVPHTVTESEFWTRFFQSHYFHRDRHALAAKDIFTECAKNDEDVMQDEMDRNVNDPLTDFTVMKDTATDEEYRGIGEDKRVSSNSANHAMIRRFNQHSTMVLRTCGVNDKGDNNPGKPTDTAASGKGKDSGRSEGKKKAVISGTVNGINGVTHSHRPATPSHCEPKRKKQRIKEKIQYDDLKMTDKTDGVVLRLTNMDRYLHGPTTSRTGSEARDSWGGYQASERAVKRVSEELKNWTHSKRQVLAGSQALGVLGELSPGGLLMSGTSLQQLHQQVNPTTREEIRQHYSALCELLRHFWACFPVVNKSLEEKVMKMKMTLERYQMTKLNPLKDKLAQYHYTMNLTGHLDEMLRAAYMKYETWEEKRKARRT